MSYHTTFTTLGTTAVTTGMVSALALAAAGSAEAQGLDGVYGGLSAGILFGDGAIGPASSDDYTFQGAGALGAFFGYQTSIGNGMVGGFEFNIHSGARMDADAASDPDDGDYNVDRMMDFRVRLGRELDGGAFSGLPTTVYGFAGYTTGVANRYYAANDYEYDFSGANYGIGADVMVNDNWSVGMELLGRTLSVYTYDGSNYTRVNQTHGQVSIRTAFHF